MESKPLPTYRFFLSETLSDALDRIRPELGASISANQDAVVQNFFFTNGVTDFDKLSDVQDLILSTTELFVQVVSDAAMQAHGHVVAHNTISAYMRQLMLNTFLSKDKTQLTIILDLVESRYINSVNMGKHWLTAKYLYEFYTNPLH